MTSELKPCPFCGCEAYITSNRDWHRLKANHDEDCFICTTDENMMVPATDDDLNWMIAAWNTRHGENEK